MSFSNTIGINTEITAIFRSGNNVLSVTKTDVDTWLFVTWEQRGDEQINKNCITLQGEQIRAMTEHKYFFTRG